MLRSELTDWFLLFNLTDYISRLPWRELSLIPYEELSQDEKKQKPTSMVRGWFLLGGVGKRNRVAPVKVSPGTDAVDAHLVAGKPLEPKSTNLRWRNLAGALANH